MQSIPASVYDNDPKGPDNNISIVLIVVLPIVDLRIIIIGPFGVMVIRGGGPPYCLPTLRYE